MPFFYILNLIWRLLQGNQCTYKVGLENEKYAYSYQWNIISKKHSTYFSLNYCEMELYAMQKVPLIVPCNVILWY